MTKETCPDCRREVVPTIREREHMPSGVDKSQVVCSVCGATMGVLEWRP